MEEAKEIEWEELCDYRKLLDELDYIKCLGELEKIKRNE